MNLLHGRRAQQRRVDVGVQLPVVVHRRASEGRAVPAHRIRERHVEQPVVGAQQRAEQLGQLGRAPRRRGRAAARPARAAAAASRTATTPRTGTTASEARRLLHTTRSPACALAARVVGEQRRPVRGDVGALVLVLGGGLVRQRVRRPDLPVRVRVRAAHHRRPCSRTACTQRQRAPSAAVSAAQVSTTRGDVGGRPSRPASDRGAGEKQTTRHVPRVALGARAADRSRRPASASSAIGVDADAAKSLSNTNVPRVARVDDAARALLPGQR